MAFDGITVAAIVHELNEIMIEGRINKIAQPEKDELMLTIKAAGSQYRLVLSANPSLPLTYLTEENKVSPAVAPTFTMLLRKHIQNGRIISITQPDFERIIVFEIEHLDEMGDICRKKLIVELMGKYSNIIFTDNNGKILDSIKHINAMTSSVREVLPGLDYFVPKQEGRINPLTAGRQDFINAVMEKAGRGDIARAISSSFTGISPMMAVEICEGAGIAADNDTTAVIGENIVTGNTEDSTKCSEEDCSPALKALWISFENVMNRVRTGEFTPVVLYENGMPKDYCMVPVSTYNDTSVRKYDSVSGLIASFYKEKDAVSRARQKSADLRKIVQTILERDVKKYDLQLKQLKDTEKMEKYRIYGELLNTYGYAAEPGATSINVDNYYTGEKMDIPLDGDLTAIENAKKYFDKYSKLKRTKEALETLTVEVKSEIDHLESVLGALDFAGKEEDINEIKEELIESGYIRRKGGKNIKQRFKSRPLHFISSDGFHMYVGKNNFQNDELTFKVANGGDWWFHAKGIPGSHVIVKTEGAELPDRTFEEAARLAAHYSRGAESGRVEVDYLKRKDVKKPNGAKPGFVVYYTNYSMVIDNNIEGLEQVTD